MADIVPVLAEMAKETKRAKRIIRDFPENLSEIISNAGDDVASDANVVTVIDRIRDDAADERPQISADNTIGVILDYDEYEIAENIEDRNDFDEFKIDVMR
ncbi:hypothetical protein CHS0354_013077 [Potamilus streckersoni]|uniref:Uncharacterized protein n=1 Tax=Potamilus streckersoni TaxID=2493646 RepID=A0AAE0VUY3_9BIVA|nr:hypothetical protein CHS0354_013077 [Potamilus streckersoni]